MPDQFLNSQMCHTNGVLLIKVLVSFILLLLSILHYFGTEHFHTWREHRRNYGDMVKKSLELLLVG